MRCSTSAGPANGRPVVDRGGLHRAQGGRDHLKVGELGRDRADHLLEVRRVERGKVFVGAFDVKAEAGGEVLLVADQHVDVLHQATVDFLGLFLPAEVLPQAGAVVEVVGDDRAVLFGGDHGLLDHVRRGFGEAGVDSARVEPARAIAAEDPLPVDVAALQLRNRRVPAVGGARRAARAEAALREVEAVAHAAAEAVVGPPQHVADVDAALQDEVLDQAADVVVGECRHDGGALAEAAAQPARDVVFASALPGRERPGRAHAHVARIEAQHHLAEGDFVEEAGFAAFDFQHIDTFG
jgi:hypothetical protein